MSAHTIKATHAAIKAYHAALKEFAAFRADHEGATETAFARADRRRGDARGSDSQFRGATPAALTGRRGSGHG
jgi:hypothetical protein